MYPSKKISKFCDSVYAMIALIGIKQGRRLT